MLLEAIRTRPKTVRVSVSSRSAGHLTVKLLLDIAGIPQDNLNLVTYSSGGAARAAVAGGIVDLIVISAPGTEAIREYRSTTGYCQRSTQRSVGCATFE